MSAHHCRRARRSRRGSDHSCRTAISFRSRGFNEVRARSTVVRRKTRVVRGMTVFGSVAARTPWYGNGTGLRTGASSEVNGGAAHEVRAHRITAFGRVGWLHRPQDAFQGIPAVQRKLDLCHSGRRCADRERHEHPSGSEAAGPSRTREPAARFDRFGISRSF